MEARMSSLDMYKSVREEKMVNWDGASINPTILDFEDVMRNNREHSLRNMNVLENNLSFKVNTFCNYSLNVI